MEEDRNNLETKINEKGKLSSRKNMKKNLLKYILSFGIAHMSLISSSYAQLPAVNDTTNSNLEAKMNIFTSSPTTPKKSKLDFEYSIDLPPESEKDYITPEILGEISKTRFFCLDYNTRFFYINHNEGFPIINFSENNTAHLLRAILSKTFSLDNKVIGSKMPNKVQQLIAQTDNVVDIGSLDAAIKASWAQQYGLHSGKFWWTSKGGYGKINAVVQGASAFEYALNQADNFGEFIRFFLGQVAISSVGEHLSYWMYVNSSIPITRTEGLFGWRGVRYPHDTHGNNDVGWMSETPAGWASRLFFNDPPGTVRKEAVFLSLPILYTFSYLVTPNKKYTKPNRFTKFDHVFYMDGVDYNKITGMYGGAKLGLKYQLPLPKVFSFIDKASLFFYASPELNARGRFMIENQSSYYSVTIGANDKGEMGFYGASATIYNGKWYGSFNYERKPDHQVFVGLGCNIKPK